MGRFSADVMRQTSLRLLPMDNAMPFICVWSALRTVGYFWGIASLDPVGVDLSDKVDSGPEASSLSPLHSIARHSQCNREENV
jgi:hypothetical protein